LKDKIENLSAELKLFTLCTDYYEFDGCGINIKHEHLFNLLKKYEFSEDGVIAEAIVEEHDLKSF